MNHQKDKKIFEARERDWSNRQIVYQIFIDRFHRPDSLEDLKKKANLYILPQKLQEYPQYKPKHAEKSDDEKWPHEMEFWGGDLPGIVRKLDYLKELGINTIYLSPIFQGWTNHKYDTISYDKIDEQFGNEKDFQELTEKAHKEDLRIIIEGVFNHIGKKSEWFQKAQQKCNKVERGYFCWRDGKILCWANLSNLPELDLSNTNLQQILFLDKDSILKKYLKYADGWRIDVGFEFGLNLLKSITNSAHDEKKDSLIIGEIWDYPEKWNAWEDSIDGVMNYYLRNIIIEVLRGSIDPKQAGVWIQKVVDHSKIEFLLKSWIILSNHDKPRLKNIFPDDKLRKLALILQFTLPGVPFIYYGEELGMAGGKDPENRAPMQWDLAKENNEDLQFFKSIISLHKSYRALQWGDYATLESENLLAFCRETDSEDDLLIVLVNPTNKKITEWVLLPEYRLMERDSMFIWPEMKKFSTSSGAIKAEIEPKDWRILTAKKL